MNFDSTTRKRLTRILAIVAVAIFVVMYGIGHHFVSNGLVQQEQKPRGIIATADYGFQKLFFGDQFSNGLYMPETSIISGDPNKWLPKSAGAGDASGPADNITVAAIPQAPAPPAASQPSADTTSSPMIAENAKFGQIGQCKLTSVAKVSTRLEDTPGSGSAINYADGTFGVSYDTVPGVDDSRQGDQIRLCLASVESDCPAGADRGGTYTAENLRTKESWSLPDSEHECGGA